MATTTTNLKLTKPAATDAADISILNTNFDMIDALGGYGLGGAKKITDDIDTIVKPGWYWIAASSSITIGGWSAADWYIRVDAYSSGATYCVQHLYPLSSHKIEMVRYKVNGTWTDTEWVRPLMFSGTEYRTTERYNGKVVYTKLVNFGALPNASSKTVATGVSAANIIRHSTRVISASGYNKPLPYFLADGTMTIKHVFANSNVQVTTNTDVSGDTAEFTIWYVKD